MNQTKRGAEERNGERERGCVCGCVHLAVIKVVSGKAFRRAGGTSGFDALSPCRRSLRNELEQRSAEGEEQKRIKQLGCKQSRCVCVCMSVRVEFSLGGTFGITL